MGLTSDEVKQVIFESAMKTGGIKCSPEEQQRREQICRACDKFGKVEPLPEFIFEGCTLCGCPVFTKTLFRAHILHGFKRETCPHPDGNKWINQ